MKVTTQMGTLGYRLNSQSDLIDLKAQVSYSLGKQLFIPADGDESYNGRTTRNPSTAITIDNTAHYDIAGGEATLQAGAKYMTTRYSSNSTNRDLLAQGKQTLTSVFADSEWQKGAWTLGAGLRYERYSSQGYLPPTDDDGTIIFPKGGNIHFNRKENHLNPHLSLTWQPLDWLSLYANWSRSSRGPNVQEFMYANNPGTPYSVNPYLKGERAENRDIGVNILKHGVWQENDSLRLKAGYFDNRIKNYILQDQFYICDQTGSLQKCDINGYMNSGSSYPAVGIYRNIPDATHMHGFELEGGYDMGTFYTNLAYSRVRTDFPHDFRADMGFSHIRSQPENIWSIDAGTRLFDQKLTLGARLSRTGQDSIAAGTNSDDIAEIEKQQAAPVLVDLYASYKPLKNLGIYVNVDNLTNRIYNYPLSGGTLGVGNGGTDPSEWAKKGTGRGRTIYAGFIWQL